MSSAKSYLNLNGHSYELASAVAPRSPELSLLEGQLYFNGTANPQTISVMIEGKPVDLRVFPDRLWAWAVVPQ